MKKSPLTFAVILANTADPFSVIANDATEIDADGWALIAPFGEHPKTRLFRDGTETRSQKFIQVLDNEAVDRMVGTENSLFTRIKRAFVGIPVFKGHGDLRDHDPKAIGNDDPKLKLGVVDRVRKTDRGIEAHFALDNDGAQAVAEGWKLPSALWLVQPIGNDGDAIRARPFKLLSVALTQHPNISGVESLANARSTEPAARTVPPATSGETNAQANTMKQLLIGWLAAQGIALSNDSTEQAVFDAFLKKSTEQTANLTTLGNDRTTLSTSVTALTNDRDEQKKRADTAATALANEQTARQAERKSRAEFAVDLIIQQGKLTVAARDGAIISLANAADFAAEYQKLAGAAQVVKTGDTAVSGKQSAALSNEATALQNEYQQAFATELVATGQNPTKAHDNIMKLPKYSGLAAKLAGQKGVA